MNKPNKAIAILVAGTGINLSIGFLYAWSVFKKAMVVPVAQGGWGWTHSEGNAAYTTAVVIWAVALLIAGVIQDKIGPKWVIRIGVLLVGGGLIASSFFQTPIALIITVGIVVATGIGFVYGCITPMCMKWFHPARKGLVSGITVAGFGVAAVYFAPLASALIQNFGISTTFLMIGCGIIAIGGPLSMIVNNPPSGYAPAVPAHVTAKKTHDKHANVDYTWREMIKTPQFYLLWIMFVFASSAGVMLIGHLASIAAKQGNIANTAIFVSLLAISNASGRVGGGFLSDKIGRKNTLLLVFTTQLVNMLAFNFYTSMPLLILGTVVGGFSYGSLMSTFPSITSDYWGMKGYGANYGVLYTAWGVCGLVGPLIAGAAVDATGNYSLAYLISAGLLAVAIVCGLVLHPVKAKEAAKA